MPKTGRLLGLAALFTLVLVGLVAHHAWSRWSGLEVRLAMEPVDPRDLLLGHYVEIETIIHTLDLDSITGPEHEWRIGDSVWVRVRPEDGPARAATEGARANWSVSEVAHQRPAPKAGAIWIHGRVARVVGSGSGGSASTSRLRARYNLERYYASSIEARRLEDLRQTRQLRLIVAVGPGGRAVIKGLEIDGTTYYDTLL